MRGNPDQQLTLDALAMAVRQRRVQPGLIHHSDQGHNTLLAYQRQLATTRDHAEHEPQRELLR
jgi:transposase InsO family protein